jgi:hypothetical protein
VGLNGRRQENRAFAWVVYEPGKSVRPKRREQKYWPKRAPLNARLRVIPDATKMLENNNTILDAKKNCLQPESN